MPGQVLAEHHRDIAGQDEGFLGGELSGEHGLKLVLAARGQVVDLAVGPLAVLLQAARDQPVLLQPVEQLIGRRLVEPDDVVQGMLDKVVDLITVPVLFVQQPEQQQHTFVFRQRGKG